MRLCLWFYPSVCAFVCLCFCLSVHLYVLLSVQLSVHLYVVAFVCLCICMSLLLSVCASVCLSFCLSVYLSFLLSVCASVCASVCLSVRLSVLAFVCLPSLTVCLSISLSSLHLDVRLDEWMTVPLSFLSRIMNGWLSRSCKTTVPIFFSLILLTLSYILILNRGLCLGDTTLRSTRGPPEGYDNDWRQTPS